MRKFFLLFLGFFALNLYANSMAISYLKNNTDINNSSYYSNKIASKFQTISEVLLTSKKLDFQLASAFETNALNFIRSYDYNNTSILSSDIILNILYNYSVDDYVDQLLINANVDGGFGDLSEYDSSIEDTSLALQSLYYTNETNQIQKSINYLASKQKVNGSWAERDNEDSIYLTALAVRTLWLYRDRYNLTTQI